jgi:tRNA U34 5-methylaminomethyl-2-thiouridine-forming methyltransferase MnmC
MSVHSNESSFFKDELQLVTTKDGSFTVLNRLLGSTYHSRHGALTESKHVFLAKGLEKRIEDGMIEVNILEMGFGTGLNALITTEVAELRSLQVNYHALELFPLPESIWKNYELPAELLQKKKVFSAIHESPWNKSEAITPSLTLTKQQTSLLEFVPELKFDVVYYDAFEPETQPELWTNDVFGKLFDAMNVNGILTTYCCKGYVRRNMLYAGFKVEKIPGPPGKREMIRAIKPL